MLNKLTILLALTLAGCTQSVERPAAQSQTASVACVSLPSGFSLVETHPQGYFVRVASSERASIGMIRTIAETLSGQYDRIDLCTDVAHERGDEYASIIDGKLYDYENDHISTLYE